MAIKVGITARSSEAKAIDRLRPYLESVRRVGGEPVILSPDQSLPPLAGIDALLLSGGGDVHPRRYGQPMAGTDVESIQEDRDEMEIDLAQSALQADMPILAICRGIQLLNVAMGGGLIQDLGQSHRTPDVATRHHLVQVEPGTRLASILGRAGQVNVNTYHHQAVQAERLAPGLRIAAWALPEGWLVEAVESPDRRFVIGVQWHPERYFEVPAVHSHLFQEFVRAASWKPSP
jgi:gamma-glutamyl-gamma-aminobutyrate hydrolase PuuD